jgi:hypothetical protein
VSVDAFGCPGGEVLLEQLGGETGLEAKGVAAEVDAGVVVGGFALWEVCLGGMS